MVNTLAKGELTKGNHSIAWNGKDSQGKNEKHKIKMFLFINSHICLKSYKQLTSSSESR